MNVPELERQICRAGFPVLYVIIWTLGVLFVLGFVYLVLRIQDIL